jgi:hypothetical protein
MDLICRKSASSVVGRDAVSGLVTFVAIQPPSIGLLAACLTEDQNLVTQFGFVFESAWEIVRHCVRFYDKGGLIANEKTLMLGCHAPAPGTSASSVQAPAAIICQLSR